MSTKHISGQLLRKAACLSAAGLLLGTSCTSDELRTVVAGFQAVVDVIEDTNHDADLNFGEWLLSELDD